MSSQLEATAHCYTPDSDALSDLIKMVPIIDEILDAMIHGRIVGPLATRENVRRYMVHIVKAHGATQRLISTDPDLIEQIADSSGGTNQTRELLKAA